MSKIYALNASRSDGTMVTIPLLLDNETLAKELADRYANATPHVGEYFYEVVYSEVDWQPYKSDD